MPDREDLEALICQHLQKPADSWIQITGTHNVTSPETSAVEQIVDFGLKAKASDMIQLARVEMVLADNSRPIVVELEDRSPSRAVEDVASRCTERFESVLGAIPLKDVRFRRELLSEDELAVDLNFDSSHTFYGGKTTIALHGIRSPAVEDTAQKSALPEGHQRPTAVMIVFWQYRCQTQRREHSAYPPRAKREKGERHWGERIRLAMVDGEQGWISLEDPVVYTNAIFRAMAKYKNYDHKRQKIQKWGVDEPSAVGPYERWGWLFRETR